MSDNVIVIKDSKELIPTSQFEYACFPYEFFNPVQSAILPYIASDYNLVIASQTSSGKSIIAEMMIAYEWYEHGKTGIYVAPLRALAEEKYTDWTDPSHHFSMLDVSQCSGDYQITQARIKELNEAHVISITPEMLAARCRNINSEKSEFIQNAGALIVDEVHILTSQGRGDAVEVLLMDVAKIAPESRFGLLSATVSNPAELGEWLFTMTGKKTVVLESDFRPVKLQIDYPTYADVKNGWKKIPYKFVELNKTQAAIKIVQKYPNDKFLIFYHTKASGYAALKKFEEVGIHTVFFNADQKKEDRLEFMRRFLDKDDLRVMLSTSSTAWGLNMPSKHVIVVGPYRGLSEVETYDIKQEWGRAGRPKYDTEGYVHQLLPYSEKEKWVERYTYGTVIDSTFAISRQKIGEKDVEYQKRIDEELKKVKTTIAHHLIAQIYNGLTTKESLEGWFKGTLAYFQHGQSALNRLDSVIEALYNEKLINVWEEEYQVTKLGRIASQFYYPPFDVASINKNIGNLNDPKDLSDRDVAYMLSNIDSNKGGYTSDLDQKHISESDAGNYRDDERYYFLDYAMIKPYTAWYEILQGNIDGYFGPIQSQMMTDASRSIAVVKAIDQFFNVGMGKQLDILEIRCKYGVQKKYAQLCRIEGIGRVRGIKLFNAGLRTFDDIINASSLQFKEAIGIVSNDIIDRIKDEARRLRG